MARKRSTILTDREVLKQIGTRKLNPSLIEPALMILRGMYLGTIYPHKHIDLVKENALIPLNKLLLDPDLAEKISDEIGPVNLSTLQRMVEDAAVAANKVPEVTNKILHMQRRVAEIISLKDPLGKIGQAAMRVLPSVPRIPEPFSGEYINQATQLLLIDTVTDNERRKIEREYVRRTGVEPIPKDNFAEMVRQSTRIMAESSFIADRLDPVKRLALKASDKTLTYTGVVESGEFKKFQSELKKKLDEDVSDLSKSEVFKKYTKDWPVLGDALITTFTGPAVGLSYITLRELATMALVVGSNPAVREQAYKFATEDMSDEAVHNLGDTINRAFTEEITNGGFKDKREWVDIGVGAVVTSPVLWEKMGVHYPGVNFPAEMMQKVGWSARNLRHRLQDGTTKRILGWFESKDRLDAEKVYGTITDYYEKTLGPKYGKEMVDKLKPSFVEKLSSNAFNQAARNESAEALRKRMYGMIKSRLAPMTDEQQMAAILKLQDGRMMKDAMTGELKSFDAVKFADPETFKAWEDPMVDDAVDYIRGRLKSTRTFDPQLPDDPTYFPASEKYIDDEISLDKFYRLRGYTKERQETLAVIPTKESLEQNIINFADRLAAPLYNSYIKDSMDSARGMATAAVDVLSEAFVQPEKYIDDLQSRIVRATAEPQTRFSKIYDTANSMFSSLQNAILLKSRAGDWLKRNLLDDSVRFAVNTYDNFKAGKIPTRQGLIDAMNQATPTELFDGMFARRLMDDADPKTIGFLSMVRNGHDPIFGTAEAIQAGALKMAYRLNYASERTGYLAKTGLSELDDAGKKVVNELAVKKSREYMLAAQANSAFATNLGSKLLISYPTFALKATEFTVNELGRSPELFLAGSRIFNMLRDTNQDNPDWQAHTLTAFGRRFSDLSSLSMAPVFSMLEKVDLDAKDKSKDTRLDDEYRKLKELPPETRSSILSNREDLRNHISKRGMTAIGTFLDTFNNSESMLSLGVGGRMALEYAGIIKRRSPYWMIGSKQLSELSNALAWKTGWEGFRGLSFEAGFNKVLSAYEQNKYGYGAFLEQLAMKKRGEFEDADPIKIEEMAKQAYANRQLRSLIFTRTFGLGAEVDDQLEKFNNTIAEFYNAREFVVPPKKDIDAIKKENGIRDDSLAEFVWKSAQAFALPSKQAVDQYRQKLIKGFREMPFAIEMGRNSSILKTWLGLNDTEDLLGQFPPGIRGDVAKTDNTYRAFKRTYAGSYVLDENGNEVYKFDDNKAVGDMMADWEFANNRKRKELFANPEMQSVLMKYAPDSFTKYKLIESKRDVIPAVETIEDSIRGEKLSEISAAVKSYNFFNPAGAAMDIFDFFLQDNPEETNKFIKASEDFGKKIMNKIQDVDEFLFGKPGSSLLGATETEFLFGDKRVKERFLNPQSREDRDAVAEADRIYKELMSSPVARKSDPSGPDYEKYRMTFEDQVMRGPTIVQQAFRSKYENLWKQFPTSPRRSAAERSIGGTLVGFSQWQPLINYSDELKDAFDDPTFNPDGFKSLLAKGQFETMGKSLIGHLKSDGTMRSLVETVELQAKGSRYFFGYQKRPSYNLDDPYEAERFKFYRENFFIKPGETRDAAEKRLITKIRDTNAFSQSAFNLETEYFRRKGEGETADILSKLRSGYFAKIPLDRGTLLRVQSFKDELPFIEDDIPLLRQRLMGDPDLVSILRTSEPRTYRGLQNKILGPYDRGWLKYVQGSQFSTESIDKLNRYNPGSYSRLYYQNEDFRLKVDTLGLPPPPPMSETGVSRDFTWNGITYKQGTPDLLAPPAAPAPDLVPPGTFSSLPSMLNYATKVARDRVFQISSTQNLGLPVIAADEEFMRLSGANRVVRSIPGLIGEGFTQGQLGPDEVIKQFREINDFGALTGAINEDDYARYQSFLTNGSNILGATRFGFNLGRFLDDTFNVPRIPVDSAVADFILAGKRFSNEQIPALNLGPGSTNIYSPGTLRSEFQANVPEFAGVASLPQPSTTEQLAQATGGAAAVAGATKVLAPTASAAAGIPGIGAALAVISAGFTIYNLAQSGRRRRRARSANRAAEEERRRQIELARAQAAAAQVESEQRQFAQQRFQQLQREESLREQSFTQRVQRLVSEGITFATLAQQPPEFVNTFVDRFEPELLSFTRRPQFDSNVNLISSIINKLPRARY